MFKGCKSLLQLSDYNSDYNGNEDEINDDINESKENNSRLTII